MASCETPNGITVTQGASKTLALYVTQLLTGDAQSLTGIKIYMTVKVRHTDVVPLILKRTQDAGGAVGEIDIETPQTDDALKGRAKIYLLPADTESLSPGTYAYDVWLVLQNGERRPVITEEKFVVRRRFTVIP